jgi:hypothetical protein
MTDVPKPLSEEELAAVIRHLEELRAILLQQSNVAIAGKVVIDTKRLVAEIRRLRQLVIDAEPYVPDSEQTRTMDLPARLRAEVERK